MTAFPKKAKFNFGRMARIELADALTVGLSTLPPVSACIPFKKFKKLCIYAILKSSAIPQNWHFWGGRGTIFPIENHSIFFLICIWGITNARRRAGGGWAKRTMSMRA